MFLLKAEGLHWIISKIHLLYDILWFFGEKSKGYVPASRLTIVHFSSLPLNSRRKVRDLGHLQKEENDGEQALSKQEFRNMVKKLCFYIYI